MELHPDYPVRTRRLRLRPLTLGDVDALLAYRGDPEVCRYLPFEPQTREQLEQRIATDLGTTELTAAGQSLTLGVESAEIDRVIGDVVLFFRDESTSAGELGYVFHPEVSGFGYATEACAAVLSLGFDDLGLQKIIARLDARNVRSAKLADRLGMRLESGTDDLIFAMTAAEWHLR